MPLSCPLASATLARRLRLSPTSYPSGHSGCRVSPGSSPGRAARLGAPSNQAAALTPPDGGGPPNAVPARRPGPASPWSQAGRLGLRPQPGTGRLAERVPSKRPAVPGCCVSPMAVSTARRFAHRAGPRSTLTTWPERSPQGGRGCRRATLRGGRGPQGACPGARPARGGSVLACPKRRQAWCAAAWPAPGSSVVPR